MYNLYNKDIEEIKEFMVKKFNIVANNDCVDCLCLDNEQLDVVAKIFKEMGKDSDELVKKEMKGEYKLDMQMALDAFANGFGGMHNDR